MRKYLMTGVAAIAFCAAFTSCSKSGDELYDPEFDNKVIAASYDEAFRKVFGNPAPTQEWGFGDNSRTRTINVNGNLWEDCPAVGLTEEKDVMDYVKNHHNNTTAPSGLENYFVTQIHKGTETYNNKDGGYVGVGSDKMNNLHIAMSSSVSINDKGVLSAEGPNAWDHINNFNAGTCNDWGAGDKDGEGNTLVLGGGTYDFAYQGADDSKYHNRWCAIDGKDVPKTGGGNYAGYYYICFDFEQNVDGKTAVYFRDETGTPQNGYVVGNYSSVAEATGAKCMVGDKEYVFGVTTGCSEWRVDNVINGNMIVEPNSSYQDWIIRLVKAKPENPEEENKETDWIRVMGEDLNASDPSDFDFNDIVIDIKITKTGADCILQAAGGTMPLRVNGDDNLEVHKLFGVGTDTMVNTGAENTPDPGDPTKMMKGVSGKSPVSFSLTGKFSSVKSVKIEVNKGGWKELTAERGVPASKIGTPKNTAWCSERYPIQQKYPKFSDWVTKNEGYHGVWE